MRRLPIFTSLNWLGSRCGSGEILPVKPRRLGETRPPLSGRHNPSSVSSSASTNDLEKSMLNARIDYSSSALDPSPDETSFAPDRSVVLVNNQVNSERLRGVDTAAVVLTELPLPSLSHARDYQQFRGHTTTSVAVRVKPSASQSAEAVQQFQNTTWFSWRRDLFSEIAHPRGSVRKDKSGTKLVTIHNPKGWPCLSQIVAGHKILVERQWLSDFWNDVVCDMDFHGLHALIGTPGIGKSTGLFALLRLILRSRSALMKRQFRFVVVVSPDENTEGVPVMRVYDLQTKKGCLVREEHVTAVQGLLKGLGRAAELRSDILVLHDIKKGPPTTTNQLSTILATSQGNVAGHATWAKYSPTNVCRRHFVPCYTDAEMELLASLPAFKKTDYAASMADPSITTWQGMAYYFGNVPRFVFSEDGKENLSQLKTRIKDFDDYDKLKAMCRGGAPKDVTGPDAFLVMTSLDHVAFRSPFVTGCLADKFATTWIRKWADFAGYCSSEDASLYERLFHQFITRHPKCFPRTAVQALNSGTLVPLLTSDSWIEQPIRVVPWTQGTIPLATQKYYRPTLPGEPFADGFKFHRPAGAGGRASFTLFQYTLAMSHHTTATKVAKFFKHLEKSLQINGKPIKIHLRAKKSSLLLQYKTKHGSARSIPLDLHVVYGIQERQVDLFTKQKCTGRSSDYPGLAAYWKKCVAQHTCPPPQVF